MSRERPAGDQGRAQAIIDRLKARFPDAHCELDHQDPLQLLVATILSAQCTDERVNQVTPALFRRFPDARALAEAKLEELQSIIRPTGFFRNKALSIQETARGILERFGGRVPATLLELTSLRGVGRKTANVILGNCFSAPEGLVVDTHVKRLSGRMGLTAQTDPDRIEADLSPRIHREDWALASHLLIWHGRYCCTARAPACGECPVNDLCPSDTSGAWTGPDLSRLLGQAAAARVGREERVRGRPSSPRPSARPTGTPATASPRRTSGRGRTSPGRGSAPSGKK